MTAQQLLERYPLPWALDENDCTVVRDAKGREIVDCLLSASEDPDGLASGIVDLANGYRHEERQ